MQLPPTTASSETHYQFITFTVGSAQAWSDAESFSPDQRGTIEEVARIAGGAAETMRARTRASDEAETGVTLARARFNSLDVVLDRAVVGVSDALLNGPAQRSRESEAYRAVFQEGTAGAVTRASLREEPELARRIVERLERGPDFSERARVLAALSGAIDRSIAARAALDEAEQRERQARDQEIEARLGVRRAAEQAYGRLRAAFTGQRDFVESFFPRRVRAREVEQEAPAAAPATA